jgi:hypothetical protein
MFSGSMNFVALLIQAISRRLDASGLFFESLLKQAVKNSRHASEISFGKGIGLLPAIWYIAGSGASSNNGGRPVISSTAVAPTDQMSAFDVTGSPEITSGAIQ